MLLSKRYPYLYMTLCISLISRCAVYAEDDNTFRVSLSGGDIVSLPSVEAAALCRHLEHTVNHATGQVSVTMPLYTLRCGDMSLPISLSHLTGGVKVEDEDGSVGVSWDMQCGGFISRRIIGRPDDMRCAPEIPTSSPTLEYLTALDHYTADGDFDRFQYKAGDYTGSFIIKNGTAIKLTDNEVKIILTDNDTFRIIIPDGTEYVYDIPETVTYHYTPMTIDSKPYWPNYDDATCLWRLGRIINPSKTDSITFEYVSLPSRQRTPSSKVNSLSANSLDTQFIHEGGGQERHTSEHRYIYNNRHGLNRIICRSGSIDFIDAGIEPSKGFTVKTPQNKEVRRIEFKYYKYRSKVKKEVYQLNSVTVTSDGKTVDGANFEYYSPGLYMGNADLFGFNNYRNGEIYSSESVLTAKIPEGAGSTENARIVISDQRLPDLDAMQSKSLKSVTTHAGATTEFVYEANTASQKFNFYGTEYALAPGLRIKQERITDRNTGNVRVKEYTYTDGRSTIDFSKIGYEGYVSLSGTRSVTIDGHLREYCTSGAVLSASCLIPGDIVENAAVYYGQVRETITGSGLECPVITDYIFDVSEVESPHIPAGKPGLYGSQMNDIRYCGTKLTVYAHPQFAPAYIVFLSPKFIHGYFKETFRDKAQLLKKTEWITDETGATTRILRSTDYVYSRHNEREYTTGYYSIPIVRTCIRPPAIPAFDDYKSIDDFNYFPIKVSTCRIDCDSVKVTEYDDSGNSRTITTAYTYDDRLAPKAKGKLPMDTVPLLDRDEVSIIGRCHLISKISKTCGGDTYIKEYLYSANSLHSVLANAATRGRISLPVNEKLRHGDFVGEKRYRYADFGAGKGNVQVSSIVCRTAGSITTDSITIRQYDRYGNPLESVDFRGINTGYAWGDAGTYLQRVSAARGHLVTKYEYSPLVGYTRITSPAGTLTEYGYDAGRLITETNGGENIRNINYYQYGTEGINKIETNHTGINGNSITEISRYDAFGNQILSGISNSANGTPIISVSQYDILGRKLTEYFPFQYGNPDYSIDRIARAALTLFDGDTEPMRKVSYQPGYDRRERTITIGGAEFASHPMKFDYRFNVAEADGDPLLKCRKYRVNGNSLILNGYYASGTLEVREATDGDGRKVMTFTDFMGNKVLSRAITDSGTADTYYIYDDAGNTVMVLSPLASVALGSDGASYDIATDDTLLKYADYYRYDNRQLLVERRMAGNEPVKYWYDAARRHVLTQDGEQRTRGVASFAIDDYYGRPALTGEAVATSQLFDRVDKSKPYALRTQTLSGRHAGYGVSIPLTMAVVDKAFYYDDYGFRDEQIFSGLDSALTAHPLTIKRYNNRGLLTGSLTRTTAAGDCDGSRTVTTANSRYIATALGYDSRERVGHSVSVDHDGIAVSQRSELSVSGLPLISDTERHSTDGTIQKITQTFEYDDFDREIAVTTVVDGVEMARSSSSYDGVGRLNSTTFRDMRSERSETLNYTYLTNGRRRSMASASGSFSMLLKYGSGALPSYSGNISGMEWKGYDGTQRIYSYNYDKQNRIVSAQYSESGRTPNSKIINLQMSTPDYSCAFDYDLNGNPLSIIRKGLRVATGPATGVMRIKYENVDNLTMGYDGNRLTKVSDSALRCAYTGAADFYDAANNDTEYYYDNNGNMTIDENREITDIVYNNVNLPVRYEFMDGSLLENTYDVDGNLLQRRHRVPSGAGGNVTSTAGAISVPVDGEGYHTVMIDYSGAWEFTDGSLSRTNIPGGYIVGDSIYFNIADHQGNIRQVWNATTGQTVQDNHYYPYGALFGESSSTEFVKAMAMQFGGNAPSEISTNPYRYGGKEWLTFRGLNLYDFAARQYDPTLGRYLSPDPLNGDYPHLSPYLYCAANPINISDPTGLKFELDDPTEANLALWEKQVDIWERFFPELKLLYDLIEESPIIFKVVFQDRIIVKTTEGTTIEVAIALKPGDDCNELIISTNPGPDTFNYSEDIFHCYQRMNYINRTDDEKKKYSDKVFEYEAKLFAYMSLNSKGWAAGNIPDPFKSTLFTLGFNNLAEGYAQNFKALILSDEFKEDFKLRTKRFAEYNERNGIGNDNYRTYDSSIPLSLFKFYQLFDTSK